MAMRSKKAGGGRKSERFSIAAVFWMLFIIVIIFLFLINLGKIKQTLDSTRFLDRLFNQDTETVRPEPPPAAGPGMPAALPQSEAVPLPPPPNNTPSPPALPFDPAFPFGTGNSADLQAGGGRAAPPVPENSGGGKAAPRERTVYFVNVDNSGMVFLSPAKRNTGAEAAPLAALITALLDGPGAAEKSAGLTTLIPGGVRLINARVQGNTAYLNFNESFLFNAYDAEGYYAQLRQIVWTATEFPNIRNVQILIDNRKVDYLGLTIRIDKPLGRESL